MYRLLDVGLSSCLLYEGDVEGGMGVLGVREEGSCAVFEKEGLYEGVYKSGAACAGCACVVCQRVCGGGGGGKR